MLGHSTLSEVPFSTPIRFVVIEFKTRRLSGRSFRRFDSDALPTYRQVVHVAQELARSVIVPKEIEKKVYVAQGLSRNVSVHKGQSRIITVPQELLRNVSVQADTHNVPLRVVQDARRVARVPKEQRRLLFIAEGLKRKAIVAKEPDRIAEVFKEKPRVVKVT